MSASPQPIVSNSRLPLWAVGCFAAYAVAVSLLIGRHEVWRDEVRALSLARWANNPVDLVQIRLVNEGHPAVWYLLLWGALRFSDSAVVLKVVAVAVAVSFSALFFFRSPFPLPHRILFLLGYLPLNQYGVIARNYGISVLFLFLLAAEYSRPRRGSPWLIGLYNALLANTNVYGAFCAIGFLLLPCGPLEGPRRQRLRSWLIVVVLTGLGGLLLAYTVWPTTDNLVAPKDLIGSSDEPEEPGRKLPEVLLATCTDDQLWTGFILTGYNLKEKIDQVGPRWSWCINLAGMVGLAGVVLLFWRAPALLAAFLTTYFLAGFFSRWVYDATNRHLGVLAMYLLALLWIQRAWDGPTHRLYWRIVLAGLLLVLMIHAVGGCWVTYRNFRVPFSQSKYAGQFLAARDPSTIVICEPDYYGDALPYYAPNDIFVVRENRFRRYVSFTASYNRSLTLGEIVAAAERLKKETGREVLVTLPTRLTELPEGVYKEGFGRDLIISADDVRVFQERFSEVAAFEEPGWETYVFYALRNESASS